MRFTSQRAALARKSFSSGLGIKFTLDGTAATNWALAAQGQLQNTIDEINEDFAGAQMDAATHMAERGKEIMRADVLASGFRGASKLSKTWRGRAYKSSRTDPDSGPQAVIWSSAPAIVAAFDDGGVIEPQTDKGWLMIPFGRAKSIYKRSKSWRGAGRRSSVTGRFVKAQPWVPQVEARLGVKIVPIFNKNGRTGVLVADTGGKSRAGFTASGNPKKEMLGFLVKEVQPGRRMKGRVLLKQVLASADTVMGDVVLTRYAQRRAARGEQ